MTAVRTGMRLLFVTTLALLLAAPAAARPGDLDRTFNGDGQLRLRVGEPSEADSVEVDSRGRVVAGGVCCGYDYGIVRLTRRGERDRTFGRRGVKRFGDHGYDYRMGLDSRDRVLVADVIGYPGKRVRVRRLRQDGSLDRRFGSRGKAMVRGTGVLTLRRFAGGALVHLATHDTVAVVRLSSRGKVLWRRALPILSSAHGLGVTPAGVVLVAGRDPASGTKANFRVARLSRTGEVLSVTALPSMPDATAYARVLVDGDADDVVHAAVAPGGPMYLSRVLPTGQLDTSFGEEGLLTVTGRHLPDAGDAELDARDRLVLAGTDYSSGSARFTVARLTPEGALDGSFGSGGVTRINAGRLHRSYANAMAMDRRQRTVTLAGAASNESGGFREDFGTRYFAFARFKLR